MGADLSLFVQTLQSCSQTGSQSHVASSSRSGSKTSQQTRQSGRRTESNFYGWALWTKQLWIRCNLSGTNRLIPTTSNPAHRLASTYDAWGLTGH